MAYRRLSNPLVLILVPVMLTLVFLVACGTEATAVPEPTQAMVAPVPTPTPVDLSGITSEMQKSIADAIAGIESPETLSEGEIQKLVQDAVAQAAASAVATVAASVPEPLSEAEIAELVEAAVAQAAASAPQPVSEAEIAAIVKAAIPTPVPPATAATSVPAPIPTSTPTSEAMTKVAPTGILDVGHADLRQFGMQPRLAGGTSDHAWRALGEGLIFVNREKEYVPWLAKDWSISADGVVWTFNIQEGVQFHKGRGEMTAEDVLWSMQEMAREDSLQSLKGQIARLWNIEAGGARVVDRYTVEVNSGKVYADMLNTMSRHHINIYSKQATDELGEEEAFEEAVATGAWQKAEIKPGEFWRMSAVEDHWRKAPEFAELILWHIPEESTRVANFQVGKLDTFEMALDSLPAIAQEPGTKFMRVPGATGLALSWFGNWYVGHGTGDQRPGYNPDLPWVSSSPDINSDAWKNAAKVRRAMSIAINRQEIVDTILAGEGQPAVMVGWGGAAHRLPEDIRSWEYDPELAKQLLAEAGYADGFSITLQAPPLGIPGAFESTQAVATMWENIGISARAEQKAYATIRPTVIDRSFNQAYLNGGSGRPDPLDLWPEIFPSTAGFTLGVSHPVLDDLMSQAVQIPDPIERDVVMVEAARFVYENTLLSAVYIVNRIWPLGPEIDSWLEHVDYSTPASLTSTQWITHRK